MTWRAAPEVDEALIAARDFISADNPATACDFLDAAFELFDLLAHFHKWASKRFEHPTLPTLSRSDAPHSCLGLWTLDFAILLHSSAPAIFL
jgi:hypothetical protein